MPGWRRPASSQPVAPYRNDRVSYTQSLPWTLESLDFNRIDIPRVRQNEDLFFLLCSSSFVESGSDLYTHNLVEHFAGDEALQTWLSQHWEHEELQHGRALAAYVKAVWPEFDWDKGFAAFWAEYGAVCTSEQLETSRGLELAARCVVETGTASLYRALNDITDEPVLKQLTGHIKSDEQLRHLPVIVISGVDDAESVVRCIEMGAEDFLPKPFDPVILRARVNAGLNRKALHDLEQERVRSVFARFVPESLVGALLDRTDGGSTIPAESLTGTVLFGDLRGFTPFAESLPVDQVIDVLNHYLSLMTDAILDNGGTLVDYMGDGVMAAFGAPVPVRDHADRAIAAARSMLTEKLPAFNGWLGTSGIEDGFRMGSGSTPVR